MIFLTDDGQAESYNMFDEAGVSWIGALCHESINARYPLAYYSCVGLGLALDIASTYVIFVYPSSETLVFFPERPHHMLAWQSLRG